MKLSTSQKTLFRKILFWILYCYIGLAIVASLLNRENPLTGLMIAIPSIIVLYFILKAIFWAIPRVWQVLFRLIPKTLWKFTLDRVRELGKAIRDD